MPSYILQLTHFVWSTSERKNWIDAEWQDSLFAYLGGIARNKGGKLLCAGGMPDHVHLLVSMPATRSLADMANYLKSNSSGWIHKELPRTSLFRWQSGYAAFSVSKSLQPRVERYIKTQAEHHRRLSYKDELKGLLIKHEIEFDETKLWQ